MNHGISKMYNIAASIVEHYYGMRNELSKAEKLQILNFHCVVKMEESNYQCLKKLPHICIN